MKFAWLDHCFLGPDEVLGSVFILYNTAEYCKFERKSGFLFLFQQLSVVRQFPSFLLCPKIDY